MWSSQYGGEGPFILAGLLQVVGPDQTPQQCVQPWLGCDDTLPCCAGDGISAQCTAGRCVPTPDQRDSLP